MEGFTNEFALARNFGFDISMPESNMGLSSVAHMDYMNRCQSLYKAFLYNMNSHIRFEKDTKKLLSLLRKEKMDNLRFSLYRSENVITDNDPFAKCQEMLSVSHTGLDSRVNTPWGLGAVPDEADEVRLRPHTAPANAGSALKGKQTPVVDDNDPDEVSVTGLSEKGDGSESIVVGIIDPKTEKTSARKITVGHHSFARLGNRCMTAKLKNREGSFIMRPIKLGIESDTSSTEAFDPSKRKSGCDPLNEKLAMVRKDTSFLSPTISSDMKINNKLPIQKSLKGIKTKRTTVVEIFRNSRDRKTRQFRIVTNKQMIGQASEGEQKKRFSSLAKNTTAMIRFTKRNDDQNVIDIRPHSKMSTSYGGCNDSNVIANRTPLTPDHLNMSGSSMTLKSIWHLQGNKRDAHNEDFEQEKDMSNSVGTFAHRPSSKVAFSRADSQMSHFDNQGQPDSHEVGFNLAGKYERNLAPPKVGNKHEDTSHNANNTGHTRSRLSSMSSVVSSTVLINKFKKKAFIENDSTASLGFKVPTKMDSLTDSKKIVKQQLLKDKELDDQMTHWRRRMTIRSSATSTKSRLKSGSGRLKLI